MLPRANGIYIIDDQFFVDFPDENLKNNKDEKRPICFCFQGKIGGLYWMVPLSRKVTKYQDKIDNAVSQKKRCDFCHIIDLAGDKSVFVTGDTFPIISKYIKREYTIDKIPVMLYDKSDIEQIHKKAKKIIELARNKIIFNPKQPDILKIEAQLIKILDSH